MRASGSNVDEDMVHEGVMQGRGKRTARWVLFSRQRAC